MTITKTLAPLLLLSCLGCGAAHEVTDGGPPSDSGPDLCDGVDRVCPESLPMIGTPCEGALTCPYSALAGCGGPDSDSAQCVDGRWQYLGLCLPVPVLYQGCRDPQVGPFPDAALALAPPARVEWGPQGGAMVALDLDVGPSAAGPRCARVQVRLTFDGETIELEHPVAMPCGRVVRLLEILPEAPCDPRMYPYAIDVEIEGVGTQHVEGELMGGGPTLPGPSSCTFASDADGGV